MAVSPAPPSRQGAPWDVSPEQVREVTNRVKSLLLDVSGREQGGGAGAGGADDDDNAVGAGGGGAQWRRQGRGWGWESRFWEVELPSFIERCLSSSIVNPKSIPFINNLFKVSEPFRARARVRRPSPVVFFLFCSSSSSSSKAGGLLYIAWPRTGNIASVRVGPSLSSGRGKQESLLSCFLFAAAAGLGFDH